MTSSLPTSATPPRHLTVRCDDDLLALAPVLLGFWPDRDVVMVTFGADRPFHARVDLPRATEQSPDALEELAVTLVVPALRHGVRAVVLLFYADVPEDALGPWAEVGDVMHGAGIEVVRALAVGDRTYHALDASGVVGAPGRAYDVTAHPFVVQALVDGRIAYRSRAEMEQSLQGDVEAIARVEAALTASTPGRAAPTEHAEHTGDTGEALGALRRLVAEERSPDDAEVATLLLGLRPAEWRRIEEGVLGRAHEERRLWAGVLPRTPRRHAVRVASALGFAAWRSGDGAMAWVAVDRARAVRGDDPSTERLADLLERAVPPAAH